MIGRPSRRRRLAPLKAQLGYIQGIDEGIDHANRIALVNPVIRASHIDPPASSYAIMRRVRAPTAERTLDPARMFGEAELESTQGQFETRTSREQAS